MRPGRLWDLLEYSHFSCSHSWRPKAPRQNTAAEVRQSHSLAWVDGMERLPGPGAGTGWDSREEGQHRSRRGFCPTCNAACCSSETPGLEAAARKAGITWHESSIVEEGASPFTPLGYRTTALFRNGTPSPPGLQGAGQPCQPGQHAAVAPEGQQPPGMEWGEPRAGDMKRYLLGPGAPWCTGTQEPGASSPPPWLQDSGLPSRPSCMPRRWPRT